MEVEEPMKDDYSRDDEEPKPWPLAGLGVAGKPDEQGFFPCSDFAVMKKVAVKPKGISFPPYAMMSQNYYEPGWKLTCKRRIKNVVCVMEWVPDVANLQLGLAQPEKDMTREQEKRLENIFGLYDVDDSKSISAVELMELLKAVGIDVASDADQLSTQIMSQCAGDEATFEDVKSMMHNQTFYQVETGRQYIALSLLEAQSLRVALHMKASAALIPESPGSAVALHTSAPTSAEPFATLDSSGGFVASARYQQQIAHMCYRFIDSETQYAESGVNLLIRALQDNECAQRVEWFTDVRGCRRRAQSPWQSAPVARVFSTADQYEFLESRAIRFRIRSLIMKKGLFVEDAFRAFNVGMTGLLTCSEMYSGIQWLGLDLDAPRIYDVVRAIDANHDGLLTSDDFKRAFFVEGDAELVLSRANAIADGEQLEEIKIPQSKIAELAQKETTDRQSIELTDMQIRKFKVELIQVDSSFTEMWTSKGTMARAKASIWAPNVSSSLVRLKSTKEKICIGHYATSNHSKPSSSTAKYLRVTDTDSSWSSDNIDDICKKFLPHPKRFHLEWSKMVGDSLLFVWKPIPPGPEFVALGMVCSNSDEPPPLTSVRVVPRKWLTLMSGAEVEATTVRMWDDSGSAGRPGGLWQMTAAGTLHASDGQRQPDVTVYKLKARAFHIGPDDDVLENIVTDEYTGTLEREDPGFQLCSEFQGIWDDRGTGSSVDAAAFRPKLQPGQVFFGDYLHGSRSKDLSGVKALVSADSAEYFAPPADFTLVCKKKKGDLKFYAWRATSPSEDFAPLGDVITTSPAKPSLPSYRCVHKVLLFKQELKDLYQVWNDKGGFWSSGENVGVWEAPKPCKTIIASASETKLPTDFQPYTVHAAVLPLQIRPLALVVKEYTPDRRGTKELTVKYPDVLTLLEYHNSDSLWKAYKNRQPNKVGFIPKSCLQPETPPGPLRTHTFRALYDWPQPDTTQDDINDVASGDKIITFKKGELVVVILALGKRNQWGFAESDPATTGYFPRSYVEADAL